MRPAHCFIAAMALAGGCSDRPLPLDTPVDVRQADVRQPQCVWHFTAPADTSDSMETPGVAHCDEHRFYLSDGVIDISVDHDSGELVSRGCIYRAVPSMAGNNVDGTRWWYATINECGLDGVVIADRI